MSNFLKQLMKRKYVIEVFVIASFLLNFSIMSFDKTLPIFLAMFATQFMIFFGGVALTLYYIIEREE